MPKFLILIITLLWACSKDKSPEPVYWEKATPSSVGLNESILNDLNLEINRGTLGQVSSLLIIKNDKLVYEQYRLGFGINELHPIYSVTKSITAGLVAIAHDQKAFNSLQEPILEYLSHVPSENENGWKEDMTIEHVLQMRSGLEWDELTNNYGHPDNSVTGLMNSTNWVNYTLDQPMSSEPGASYTYNSGCTVLLSGLIESTTGSTTEAFAKEHLFDPLSINRYSWTKTTDVLANT